MLFDTPDECDATPDGLMLCLNMLAEEAAVLHLPRTLSALRAALCECRSEMQDAHLAEALRTGVVLH